MSIDFPTKVEAYATPFAVALVVALVIQLLIKPHLKEWRWTPLVALGLGEILALAAAVIIAGGKPNAANIFSGTMVGFFGWALAVAGYEGITNVLGLLGKGPRSNAALHQASLRNIERCIGRMPRID